MSKICKVISKKEEKRLLRSLNKPRKLLLYFPDSLISREIVSRKMLSCCQQYYFSGFRYKTEPEGSVLWLTHECKKQKPKPTYLVRVDSKNRVEAVSEKLPVRVKEIICLPEQILAYSSGQIFFFARDCLTLFRHEKKSITSMVRDEDTLIRLDIYSRVGRFKITRYDHQLRKMFSFIFQGDLRGEEIRLHVSKKREIFLFLCRHVERYRDERLLFKEIMVFRPDLSLC